jgi:hypothetical protein
MIRLGFGIAAALLLAATTSIPNQQADACTTYILPYVYDQRLGLLPAPGMTADESTWLEKKGKKRYPGFCFTRTATYVLLTIRGTTDRVQTETRTESAITTGPVTTVVGQTASSTGQPSEPIWSTQLAHWVTTWQSQVTEVVHEPYAIVLIFETKDGKPLSSTTELRLSPVLQAKGAGRHASRDALEFVLQHWSLKLTSCADGATAESCK